MRAEKTLLLDEIKGQFDTYSSFVIMGYEGFTANEANAFRTTIAGLGGDVEMVPKRVLVKAADEAGVTLDKEKLPGHISLVFAGQEPFETAKVVCKYSKDSKDRMTVLGGRFEGQLFSGEDVEKLAKLPGMDQLRAEFVGLLEAPMTQIVSLSETLLSSIIICLENKAEKDGSE